VDQNSWNFRKLYGPLAVANAVSQFSMSCFVLKIFAIKCQSCRKTNNCMKFLVPSFSGGMTPTVCGRFVSVIYFLPFGKLGSVCSPPSAKPDCLYHVFVQMHRPLKLPLSCEIVENRWFWAPDLKGKEYPKFWTCSFKLHLLPSMWSVLVKFCLVRSEGSW